jgi:hypothetical protein
MRKTRLSAECLEQAHTWIMARCPCALEDPEFLRGIIEIIEEEVACAIRAERQDLLAKLSQPSPH